MITLNQWLECINYRVSEGTKYTWACFPNAYILDYWNGSTVSSSAIFNPDTKTVFCVEVFDYTNNRAYRFFNDDSATVYAKFVKDNEKIDCAWCEDVDGHEDKQIKFIDLEVAGDFIEKCMAIIAGKEYDARILVPLILDKQTLEQLIAHAELNNVSLDSLVNSIMEKYSHAKI